MPPSFIKTFKRQPNKKVKHNQTIRRLLPPNCLGMFDHFVRSTLKGLKIIQIKSLFHLKTSKNPGFPYVFRGNRKYIICLKWSSRIWKRTLLQTWFLVSFWTHNTILTSLIAAITKLYSTSFFIIELKNGMKFISSITISLSHRKV